MVLRRHPLGLLQDWVGGQHDSPICPHVEQPPAMHVVLRVSQQAPVHVFPAQQGCPTPPHAMHVPVTHEKPVAHTLPEQHASPDPPHVQLPPVQVFPLLHVPPAATQPVVSQHPPPLQVLPEQHANPEAPQAWHEPPAQTLPEAAHAAPLLTHLLVPGSQQSLELHMPPVQHA